MHNYNASALFIDGVNELEGDYLSPEDVVEVLLNHPSIKDILGKSKIDVFIEDFHHITVDEDGNRFVGDVQYWEEGIGFIQYPLED
jgi:hypothetical protein